MSESVLVIAAHPDDEVLGCGGTIARHTAHGDTVDILFLADGETSRGAGADTSARQAAARKAAAILGASEPVFLGLPDNRLDCVPFLDVVQAVEAAVQSLSPTIVYTHSASDLNIDHVVAQRAAMTCFRPMPNSSVRSIYAFEVPSSTGWSSAELNGSFEPVHFVDIERFMPDKREALLCYDGEMRSWPHARSYEAVEALARVRGATVGLEACEAFSVLRDIKA